MLHAAIVAHSHRFTCLHLDRFCCHHFRSHLVLTTMKLTILNLTEVNIVCSWPKNRTEDVLALPSRPVSVTTPKRCSRLTIMDAMHTKEIKNPAGYLIRFTMACGASWKTLSIAADCPWQVYTVKVEFYSLQHICRSFLGSGGKESH